MFTGLRQQKQQLIADVPVGSDSDGTVTMRITVPTNFVRTPESADMRRVRLALAELNAALTQVAQGRLRGVDARQRSQQARRAALAGVEKRRAAQVKE
jgi:hypothetical protein